MDRPKGLETVILYSYDENVIIFLCSIEQGLLFKEGVDINETWTSLKFVASSNFSRDGEEFTCQFTNSLGIDRKTFRVSLLKSDLNVGIYAAIGIAVAIIVILLSCLIRNIYLMKVFYLLINSTLAIKQKSYLYLETR